MFHFKNGNLLDSQVQALVNTVNTVGVMGKGIALAFKQRFPENFRLYANACRDGRVRVGTMFVTEHASMLDPKWIVNFPTKDLSGSYPPAVKYPAKDQHIELYGMPKGQE